MSGAPHLSCHRGKRVRIILRSGTTYEDRFVERKSKFVILEQRGRVRARDIKSFTIVKEERKDG